MMWIGLAAIGLIIILALGFYAGRLLFQLKEQNKRQQLARERRTATIIESIQVIVKAMQQQQCELSEGAIRICNLLEALPLSSPPDYSTQYPKLYEFFHKVSGFAILEARAKLPKSERMRQDVAREQIESEYENAVLKELPALQSYCATLELN
ncbi:DUF2489 domain-containing protein [Alteromonas sp. ASW11-130]|uniref:DUF2489 domain-containing protein n=1 Tax=Alteromonas sp. ASW11-130 TaxID=3015775 RepID=UPI002241D71F|nr:DUF2489 domain-containing protein [Alteromonas sp. ASW11-130]MCW8093447.1 DUF2489 domain-containing protein [Alteromonas sp. ASW11-130]